MPHRNRYLSGMKPQRNLSNLALEDSLEFYKAPLGQGSDAENKKRAAIRGRPSLPHPK